MTLIILGSAVAVAGLAYVWWKAADFVLTRIELRSCEQLDSTGE
jgi:hypothetical protein